MTIPSFWFKFEGSGQYAVDSVSGLLAKMYDSAPGDRGVTFSTGGYSGNSLSCDGSNSSGAHAWESDGALVEISPAPSSPETTFTLACRFKTAVKQQKVMVCLNKDGDTQPHVGNIALELKTSPSNYGYVAFHYWYVAGGGVVINTATTTDTGITNGQWHSAIVVANGSSCTLYVDTCSEAKDTDATVPYTTTGTWRWRIGGGADGNAITDGVFDGMLDDVRYWNRALLPVEICIYMAGGDPDQKPKNEIMFSCNT